MIQEIDNKQKNDLLARKKNALNQKSDYFEDISFFDGHLHIEDYLDQEQAKETFFDYMEISQETQVKNTACYLKGATTAWWLFAANPYKGRKENN